MDLPKTERGNKHVLVLQGLLDNGIPHARSKNHMYCENTGGRVYYTFVWCARSIIITQRYQPIVTPNERCVQSILGTEMLNITAYHPQCNGLTERFNRDLKTMLRKQAATYGLHWDRYLYGVLWAEYPT